MAEPLLTVSGLTAFYDDVQVLWGVDLEVVQGRITAVIGPNGAGKTTLMRAVIGLRPPVVRQGEIVYRGESVTNLEVEAIVRRGAALVPEGARVFPEMTCLDNLLVGAHPVTDQGEVRERLAEVLEVFPIFKERAGQRARTLSGGERQMLALARALMGRPDFLLLDEPSLGLSPLMAGKIFELIRDINRAGVSVLLIEQKVGFALKMADRAYVLENGRVALAGSGRELLGHEHVRRVYLSV